MSANETDLPVSLSMHWPLGEACTSSDSSSMAPNFLIFFFDVLEAKIERGAADGGAAAAEGADAVLHDGGVAVENEDVVDADAEFVGGDLREGGLFALAVG